MLGRRPEWRRNQPAVTAHALLLLLLLLLQASQKQAERNLQRTTASLQGAIEAIGRMEGELQSSSDKYVYLQKLRAYVQDLCYMLQVGDMKSSLYIYVGS